MWVIRRLCSLPLLRLIIKTCAENAEAVESPINQPGLTGILRNVACRKALTKVAEKKLKMRSLL